MKKYLLGAVVLCLVSVLTSCREDEDFFPISTDAMASQCTDNGVWSACFTNTTGFDIDGIHFRHNSTSTPYQTWSGFCPSIVRDTKEYYGDEWMEHQWASIAGGSSKANGEGSYLVCYWDSMDADAEDPLTTSCVITGTDGITFMPFDINVSNTTWAYYAMKNGTAFSEPFDSEDWFKLTITGYRNGLITGSVDVMLAEKGYIVPDWQHVRLKSLGLVDHMVFSLTSSDTGDWGINTPTFFCVDSVNMR